MSRFEHLSARFLNGELNAAETAEFCRLLQDDEKLQAFVSEAMVDSQLRRVLHGQRLSQAFAHHATSPPRSPSRWRIAMPWIRAAMIVIGIGIVMSLALRFAGQRLPDAPQPVQLFATILDVRDAEFDASDLPTSPGDQLPGGHLRLKRGEVDIEFFSGAQVTIKGPAVFAINSAMRGFLESGRLTAHVPDSAVGFTIGTSTCAVVDLGTRFAMAVDDAGEAEVYVLDGQVQVRTRNQTKSLIAGQATRVSRGRIDRIPVESAAVLGDLAQLPRVELDGQVRWAPVVPRSVAPGDLQDPSHILLVPERMAVGLQTPLLPDIAGSGTFDAPGPAKKWIEAGRTVHSFLLHADVPRDRALVGTVTFSQPIVGVFVAGPSLTATDELLGLHDCGYSPAAPRGIELGEGDAITISRNLRTLKIRMSAFQGSTDQIRVVVQGSN